MPRSPAPALLSLALTALLLAGCVTERLTPARGTPVRPSAPVQARQAPAPSLPSGPVASPAPSESTVISRITAAIKPLGPIPYDGVSLPLTSPDGRFIAVQQGVAPSWDAIFALPDADPPIGARIGIYRVGDTALEPVAAPNLDGLILGRSADDAGFLVESVRPDGSRWIGHAPWQAAPAQETPIRWLVQTQDHAAHAILTAAGDLLFTRRNWGGGPPTLIWRRAGGMGGGGAGEAELALPDAQILIPLAGQEPGAIGVLIGSDSGGLELAGVTPAPPQAGQDGLTLHLGPRRTVGAAATPAIAYQSVAPLQVPLPTPSGVAASGEIPVFLHSRQRMGLFSPQNGSVVPLLPESVAAAPASTATPDQAALVEGGVPSPGYLVSVPRGMVFLPVGNQGLTDLHAPGTPPVASIVTGTFLPRITSKSGCVLLFGQSPNGGRSIYEVSVIVLGVPPAP